MDRGNIMCAHQNVTCVSQGTSHYLWHTHTNGQRRLVSTRILWFEKKRHFKLDIRPRACVLHIFIYISYIIHICRMYGDENAKSNSQNEQLRSLRSFAMALSANMDIKLNYSRQIFILFFSLFLTLLTVFFLPSQK